MPIELNLGGVQSAGKPLPEGEYLFKIQDATLKPSQKTGDNLLLKISVEEPVEFADRVMTENINIQQSTLPFVKAFYCALTGMDDDDVTDINLDENELPGNKIVGVVKHREDSGVTYGNVVAWKHAG